MLRPLRAVVIDDSAYNRVTISRMLGSSPKIKVVATAVNGEDGIKQVMKHKPDVITLDLEMPVMDGFAFLRWLMANLPTPVIAVSSRSSDRSVFKALDLGAIDFIAKPGGRVSPRLEEIERDLVAKVLQVAEIRMENLRRRITDQEETAPREAEPPAVCEGGIELVAIGCSTGGPPALQYVFQNLPMLPIPIVVAQHMPQAFTRLFAERVNKLTSYTVKEGDDGEMLENGTIYVAPGGTQMEVRRTAEGLQIRTFPAKVTDLYAPSVDRLIISAGDACGERLVAIILTGMGDDGAQAIRRVRERGGRTIAESPQTAIIFGMPNEAIKTGCVDLVLPLGEIPEAIQRLCTG
ncbi:MAG TPA: chemotaxis-specific protein-glutamate methyltransferase CheB [Thermoanaerobaculia bacterium]|jgi:two-component system chemotaxis response regulator CheB|nr:chemotaxis-specific protein-glutamate methyltransferase CheB [Thermoanaerobaculia bacterium]